MNLTKQLRVSGKKEPADLVIKNGRIVNVFTGELMNGDIAIAEGKFVGIGSYEGKTVVDAKGKYIVPGFIDGHVHIESAMVTPPEFARIVLPHGVTTVVADPHEIANVAGQKGIQFMIDSSVSLLFDVYFMLPSCVPATPFENAGATLLAEDLASFYQHPKVLGLAEVMDFPSVAEARPDMIKKLETPLNFNRKIDGHAAGISREDLNIYMTAGIRTDHECIDATEAKNRLDLGMYLMIRQGSVAKDLDALLPAVTEKNSRRCLFITDDKHLDDLIDEGSIDYNVRRAIQKGISPVTAIQMATLNAAECFGLAHLGAIAPGYQADLLLLDNLEDVSITHVFKKGELVVESGKLIAEKLTDSSVTPPVSITQSVSLPPLSVDQLRIPLSKGPCHIIGIIPNSLVTEHLLEDVQITDSEFIPSIDLDQMKIAVIERHHQTGNIGLGIVKGFGMKKGAIATTIAHDSHNLIVVGQNDQDMIVAAECLGQMRGGIAVVSDGRVLASLPLPIAGLLSDQNHKPLYEQLYALNKAALELGMTDAFNPFITLSFLALPVIPHLKLTDIGLFEFSSFKHIPVEAP